MKKKEHIDTDKPNKVSQRGRYPVLLPFLPFYRVHAFVARHMRRKAKNNFDRERSNEHGIML